MTKDYIYIYDDVVKKRVPHIMVDGQLISLETGLATDMEVAEDERV